MLKRVWDYVSGSQPSTPQKESQSQSQSQPLPRSSPLSPPRSKAKVKESRRVQEEKEEEERGADIDMPTNTDINMPSSPLRPSSRGGKHTDTITHHSSSKSKKHKQKSSKQTPRSISVEEDDVEVEVPATAEPAEEDVEIVEEEIPFDDDIPQKSAKKRKRELEADGSTKKKKKKSGETVTLNGTLHLGNSHHSEEQTVEQDTLPIEPAVVQETPKKRKHDKKKKPKDPKPREQTPEAVQNEQPKENYDVQMAESSVEPEPQPQPSKKASKSRALHTFNNPPPKVIIPTPIDDLHHNSKGVPAPPLPERFTTGAYSSSEDALIHAVIHKYCAVNIPSLSRSEFIEKIWSANGSKTDFWNVLLHNLPTRSRESLYCHVKRMYHNFEERGKWTEEQDDELRTLVAQKGTKWSVIAKDLNRMPEDLRDRWKNYLVCGSKRRRDHWEAHEEVALKKVMDDMLAVIVKGHEEAGTLVLAERDGETAEERVRRLEEEKWHHREEVDWGIASEKMGYTRSRMQCLWKAKGMWKKETAVPEDASVKPIPKRVRKDKKEATKPKKDKKEATKSKKGKNEGETAKKGKKQAPAVEQEEEEEEEEEEEDTSPALQEAKKMKPGDYLFLMQRILSQSYDRLETVDWDKIASMDPIKYFTAEQFKVGFHHYIRDNNPQRDDLRSFITKQIDEMKDLPMSLRGQRFKGDPGPKATPRAPAPVVENHRSTTPELSGPDPKPTFRARKSSKHAVVDHDKPIHSPSNPFVTRSPPEQRGGPSSPSTARKNKEKREKREASSASKEKKTKSPKESKTKSPKKKYISAEYLSDTDTDEEENEVAKENDGQEDIEEVEEEEQPRNKNLRTGADEIEDSTSQEEEMQESGLEADDEMGQSEQFGQVRRRR
ncbi:hypothetical protein TWF694_005829 [Orbilia ellipsospora]|uniref:DNA-binding protein REB1 n=1 Tax=Orbilia ellipsospora TaxID=2528407 RepID=A0AAV9WS18_9PEZI